MNDKEKILGFSSIDPDFDENFYLENYPRTKGYFDGSGFSLRERLYHHYLNYGQDLGFFKSKLEIELQSSCIIIIVFDNLKNLRRSIASIINQTFKFWKVIVVNDKPNELSIGDIGFKSRQIEILNIKKSIGRIRCIKAGIVNSIKDPHYFKEIIGILKSGDVLRSDAIARIVEAYNNNEENVFVFNDFKTFIRKYYYLTSGFDDFGNEEDIFLKLEKFCKPILLNEPLLDCEKDVDVIISNKIHPNYYFDQIYVINLVDEVVKKQRISKIFSQYNINCKFIEAFDGRKSNEYEKTKIKLPGVYGYCVSMISILEDAINNNYNKILVCDDDIILHKKFDTKFDECVKEVPYTWKVLFLGLSGPWEYNKNTFLYKFNYEHNYATNLIGCAGSFCVGYDKCLFQKLIELTKEFTAPFDNILIDYLNDNPSIEKYAFYPQLVIADTVKESTIENYQYELDVIKNFERNHLRFMVNLDEYDLDSLIENKYKKLEIK